MKTINRIKFGTDGWRDVIGENYTFDNVRSVAQATADYFKQNRPNKTKKIAVIGFDRRFLSDEFAQLVAEIMAGNGFKVLIADGPVPTPVVSWHTHKQKACFGIMITASHNPARFNGYKIKLHHGGPADGNTCRSIEQKIGKQKIKYTSFATGCKTGKIRPFNLMPNYFSALKMIVDFKKIQKSGLSFAHEPLFGVGASCFDELLKNSNCTVRTFNATHDPNFGGINPEPIESNYSLSSEKLKHKPADFCLVTDGDADRIGGMDGNGRALTTHQIICLLLHHFISNRKEQGRVVKALTTTSMVDAICQKYGLTLTETGVGFKYICEEMLKGGTLLGFEESGGIGFPCHIPERDGILAGLMVLELLAVEGKPLKLLLNNLKKSYGNFEYGRVDTHFPISKRSSLMKEAIEKAPKSLLGEPVQRIQSFDGVKYTNRSGSWLMLRGSGTEPVLRIYAEAPSSRDVNSLLKKGRALAKRVEHQ